MDFMKIAEGVRLAAGSHKSAGREMCVNEGETHSDHPACECPVVAAFVIGMNDMLPDAERQRLIGYIPRLAGSRSTPDIEDRRVRYLAWRATTVFAASAMDAADLGDWATRLRACPDDPAVAQELAASAARAAWAARAARAAWAARAARDAWDAWDARAASAAWAAWDASAAIYSELFVTLDGVLAIGGEPRGITKPLPAPGEAARVLCMVRP